MSRKIITRSFYIIFGVCFIVMLLIMIKGFIDQKNDEKKETARYEKMIKEGEKTILDNKILEEDHDKFLEDSSKGRKTFISLLVCFGTVFVMFAVMTVFSTILSVIESRSGLSVTVAVISLASVIFIFVTFAIVMFKVVIPKFAASDASKDAYSFVELSISDRERKEERVTTGTGDSRTTETRIYYYYITENGQKIQVSKLFYDRFVGPGIYYAGRTAGGKIFSIYPGEYFELNNS